MRSKSTARLDIGHVCPSRSVEAAARLAACDVNGGQKELNDQKRKLYIGNGKCTFADAKEPHINVLAPRAEEAAGCGIPV